MEYKKTIRLWENNAPGSMGSEDKDIPTLTLYFPEKRKMTGSAIVICPGGGFIYWQTMKENTMLYG